MADNYSPKAQALRDELAAELLIKRSALVQVKSFGASKECDLLIGPSGAAAGTDSAFIRIKVQSTLATDVLGLAQQVYTPHVAQVVFEANPAGGAGADVGTWATRLAILGALLRTGVRVEIYFSANTVAVSSAGITGTPEVFDSLQYPLMSTM
jgi:hypothetical protein